MELIVRPNGLPQVRKIVEMENKPALAKFYERPKIYEYPEEVQNTNLTSTIDYLLNLMAVNGDDKVQQHAAAFIFMKSKLNRFTFEEIIEAFHMHVAGELGTKVFRELNAVTMGEVLNKFEEIRNQSMRTYFNTLKLDQAKEMQLSPEEYKAREIESLKYFFMEWANTGVLPTGASTIYDYLNKIKLLKPSAEERRKQYSLAQTKLAKEAKIMSINKQQYSEVMASIESDSCSRAIVISKTALLSSFFSTFIPKGNSPEDSLRALLNLIK